MIRVRPAAERGQTKASWLDARHTFSFNRYWDPDHVQFRTMRVLNEDRVAPGQGFGAHPHNDMEILTWILSGGLAHKDSTGGGGEIRHGELQYMSAGTGVYHSEFNASDVKPVHLFQIWIAPNANGLTPKYEQRAFAPEGRANRLQRIASGSGADEAIEIRQDAEVFAADLAAGQSIRYAPAEGRGVWLQLGKGTVTVNGVALNAGDGVAISDETSIEIQASADAHFLLFDLA